MGKKIWIREIFFGTPEHAQELELRNEVLRKPLGLNIYDQDLAAEKNNIRIAAILADPQNQSQDNLPLLAPDSQLELATEAGSDFSSDSAQWELIHNINSFHRDASNRMSRPPSLGSHSDLLIGCLLLFPLEEPGSWQLRQMAVAEDYRHLGLGRRMLELAEEIAQKKEEGLPNQKDRQAIKLILNARKEALGFYEKSGYKVHGSEFLELGIPHYRMEKLLLLQ